MVLVVTPSASTAAWEASTVEFAATTAPAVNSTLDVWLKFAGAAADGFSNFAADVLANTPLSKVDAVSGATLAAASYNPILAVSPAFAK